jgi:hypothetical protein
MGWPDSNWSPPDIPRLANKSIKTLLPFALFTDNSIFNVMIRLALSFFSFLPLFFSGVISKKEQILSLSKKYFPENYTVLKEYDESSINSLAKGDSLKDYIYSVSTIVHEGYHHYQGLHSSYYDTVVRFRINDTLSFAVKNFKTFPAIEINHIVPLTTRKKIFRYDAYINTKEKLLVTQQFGILGLLEECIAYYHSFGTEIALFHFFKDRYGWSDPNTWINYLSNVASDRYAINEFSLFISWYMQYARSKYPEVFRAIIANTELKNLFTFLRSENKRLTSLYDENRVFILQQLGNSVQVRDNFIYNVSDHYGKGLYDTETRQTADLLKNPEHRILDQLSGSF